jgi:integrase
VQPSGQKSFTVVASNPSTRKQVWAVIGDAAVISVADSRAKARTAIERIRAGLNPFETPPVPPENFHAVAERWLKRHVRAKGLRTEGRIERLLQAHLYPAWKARPFVDIKRSDVAALMDEIEDDHGARQADMMLALISAISNWYAARHDSYQPPFIRTMKRTSPKETARSRILNDEEIRGLWQATADGQPFSAFIRLLLLTAVRRSKLLGMQWGDIDTAGVWQIRRQAREKGAPAELVLPAMAIDIIRAQPRMGGNPFVFAAARCDGPIGGIGRQVQALKAKLSQDMPGWVLHDLRRTARSLMSRAGVLSEHAERGLGHSIRGVEGVYDRHKYRDEVASALARLAALIDGIVNPRGNVVPMAKAKRV